MKQTCLYGARESEMLAYVEQSGVENDREYNALACTVRACHSW